MNSAQIEHILTQHCSQTFGGVFGAENYSLSKIPCFLVLNTDLSFQSGQHWVVLYINSFRCEFFDSLGHPPSFYHKHWEKLLEKYSSNFAYNKVCLQDDESALCGEFCIFYIVMRNNGFSFSSILNMANSTEVKNLVKRLS